MRTRKTLALGAAPLSVVFAPGELAPGDALSGLELVLNVGEMSTEGRRLLTGVVRAESAHGLEGWSVCSAFADAGACDEVFVSADGSFRQEIEWPGGDLELSVRDGAGREVALVLLREGKDSGPRELVPPWPEFVRRVRRCLNLAADVARASGQPLDELIAFVHSQERYGEQARDAADAAGYRECGANLERYAQYLDVLLRVAEAPPGWSDHPVTEDAARDDLARFRAALSEVWKRVRAAGREELEAELASVAAQGQGLSRRQAEDAAAAHAEARRLYDEVRRLERRLRGEAPAG